MWLWGTWFTLSSYRFSPLPCCPPLLRYPSYPIQALASYVALPPQSLLLGILHLWPGCPPLVLLGLHHHGSPPLGRDTHSQTFSVWMSFPGLRLWYPQEATTTHRKHSLFARALNPHTETSFLRGCTAHPTWVLTFPLSHQWIYSTSMY